MSCIIWINYKKIHLLQITHPNQGKAFAFPPWCILRSKICMSESALATKFKICDWYLPNGPNLRDWSLTVTSVTRFGIILMVLGNIYGFLIFAKLLNISAIGRTFNRFKWPNIQQIIWSHLLLRNSPIGSNVRKDALNFLTFLIFGSFLLLSTFF